MNKKITLSLTLFMFFIITYGGGLPNQGPPPPTPPPPPGLPIDDGIYFLILLALCYGFYLNKKSLLKVK
jgi:hypothetical protein